MMTQGEVDRLLGYMPIICGFGGISKADRDFCISICGRLKRGAFSPSGKQIYVMKRIVAAFQERLRDDGGEVTE